MQNKYNKQLIPMAKKLRKEMTKEEKHLWYDFLKTYPVKFTRQKVLGKYIVDFYCAEKNLVIELDGAQHLTEEAIAYDNKRTEFLELYGVKVLRIPNININKDFSRVCEAIDEIIKQQRIAE